MVSFIIIITVATVFSILCSILLRALNESILKLFVPIQKLTSKLKKKRLYSSFTLIALITISASLRDYYKLSDIKYGLLLGFIFSLEDIIFDIPIGDKR